MALTPMYEGKNNSPQTDITSAITASDAVIPVTDISVFPDAPNLATIGNDENAEVIRYNGKDGSTLTGCERGFGGTTASLWPAATVISRQITKYDLDTLKANVAALDTDKAAAGHNHNDLYFQKSEIDSTPTADSTVPVTSGGVKAYADQKILYFYQQTTSVTAAATTEFCRITDARITEDTVVLECTCTVPSAITSDVSWTSAAGYISLKGICTSNTCKVNLVVGKKGN